LSQINKDALLKYASNIVKMAKRAMVENDTFFLKSLITKTAVFLE
jgi:hypothetical protein